MTPRPRDPLVPAISGLLLQPGGFEGLAQGPNDLPQHDASDNAHADVRALRHAFGFTRDPQCPSEGCVGALTDRTSRPELSFREGARGGRSAHVDCVVDREEECAALRSAQSLGWLNRVRRRRGRSGHRTDESRSNHHARRCDSNPPRSPTHVVLPFRGQAIRADPSSSTGASLHTIRAESRNHRSTALLRHRPRSISRQEPTEAGSHRIEFSCWLGALLQAARGRVRVLTRRTLAGRVRVRISLAGGLVDRRGCNSARRQHHG